MHSISVGSNGRLASLLLVGGLLLACSNGGGGTSPATSGTGGAGGGTGTGGSGTGGGSPTGTGGGAGTTGDGGPDGNGGGNPVGQRTSAGCAGQSLLFCEDFEALADGPASSSRWTTQADAGSSLTVESSAAPAAKALHIHTQGNQKGFLRLGSFSPPGNSFFGRMWIWVDAFPTAPDFAHFTLVEAAGAQPGLIRPIGGQYIAAAGGGPFWGVGTDGGPTGDWTNWKATAPTAARRWVCMEWEMNAADNNINVWIDGTAKPELSVSTKSHGGSTADFVFPTFDNIWFGWWLYQSGSTPDHFDVWLDDIALGATRVGCGT